MLYAYLFSNVLVRIFCLFVERSETYFPHGLLVVAKCGVFHKRYLRGCQRIDVFVKRAVCDQTVQEAGGNRRRQPIAAEVDRWWRGSTHWDAANGIA